jgi:hypothetical protein
MIDAMESFRLNNDDIKCQSYDINPRALYMTCDFHNINITLCDMEKNCVKAITFFGIVQCIFCHFLVLRKRWNVLFKHVPSLM